MDTFYMCRERYPEEGIREIRHIHIVLDMENEASESKKNFLTQSITKTLRELFLFH